MFEQIKKKEFLALYEKFRTGARWLADREAAGKDNKAHLADFRKIEAQIDTAWDCMPEAQKDEITALLAQNKAIPEAVCQAKELFAGKLVSIT